MNRSVHSEGHGRGMQLLLAAAVLLLVAAALPRVQSLARGAPEAPALDPGSPALVAAIAVDDLAPSASLPWRQAGDLVAAAAAGGARFVVLPERLFSGAPQGEAEVRTGVDLDGPLVELVSRLARRHQVWLALSVPERADGGGFYTTLLVLDPAGETIYRRRKVASGALAGRRGQPRDVAESIDVGPYRIGALSGDDLRVGVPRLAQRGAEIILVSAAWPEDRAAAWLALCGELSRRYRVELAVANRAPLGDRPVAFWNHRGDALRRVGESGRSAAVVLPLDPAPRTWRVRSSLGLPSVPLPTHEPITPAIVEIGRALFNEPGLSRTGEVSCASCHRPDHAFADGERFGRGVDARRTARNVPSLLNVAYHRLLQWNGEVGSLEAQVKYPLSGASEMDAHYLDEALAFVRSTPRHAAALRAVFGVEEIEFEHVARALASYERTLVSAASAFDRAYYRGEDEALSASARRGLALFAGRAGCAGCHVFDRRSALFTDGAFHNTGVGYDRARGGFADPGLGLMASQTGLFRTPSLRDVARTAPYMHDGSLATLEEVVEFYDRGGEPNPHLDPALRPLALDETEKRDLVAFLQALDGEAGDRPLVADFDSEDCLPVAALQGAGEALAPRLARVAAAGARLVVLPEAPGAPSEAELGGLAVRHRVWIAAGVREEDAVVEVLVDDQGRTIQRQHKLSPQPHRGEGAVRPGELEALRAVDTPFGRLGVLSGDDLDDGLPRLAELGAETVLVSAPWRRQDGVDHARRAARLAGALGVRLVVATHGEKVAGLSSTLFEPDDAGVLQRSSAAPADALYASLERTPGLLERTGRRPLGLPALPEPPFNRLQQGEIALGEELFFDRRLSASGTISCATCHVPPLFADELPVAVGVSDRRGEFNVPSLLNTGYRKFLFWEGNVRSLEAQVQHALQGWSEMNTRAEEALAYVRSQPRYRRAFRQITGRDEITFDDLAQAIASYERSLVSGDSPFDRFYFAGDETAIPAGARRGFELFSGRARCAECHAVGEEHALFTDDGFHNTGVGYHPRFDYLGYKGNGVEGNFATGNAFTGEYHTPSLRNIAETAPYMHDGSLASLEEVVEFYDRGGIANPFLDPKMRPLELSAAEKADLVAFLETLSGELPARGAPIDRLPLEPQTTLASHGE